MTMNYRTLRLDISQLLHDRAPMGRAPTCSSSGVSSFVSSLWWRFWAEDQPLDERLKAAVIAALLLPLHSLADLLPSSCLAGDEAAPVCPESAPYMGIGKQPSLDPNWRNHAKKS
jgi:hypothetical protein